MGTYNRSRSTGRQSDRLFRVVRTPKLTRKKREALIDQAFEGIHMMEDAKLMSLLKYVAFKKVSVAVLQDFMNESPAYRRGIEALKR